MATPIIHDEQRVMEMNRTLQEYGIVPGEATRSQKEMADCIAQKTSEALTELRRNGGKM